ncbi:ABC transporter permease [Rhizobium rhizogenes]|uniref:ABC transporter permease n=1 Tax=Rhizobium rhizogenes TaxID=359 RepID=UPI0015744ECB|nr:ABC transporter permease [Rhizobium rhizogenes]NTI76587.1 ABC transporter permease [Rhizobium rhizogenes]
MHDKPSMRGLIVNIVYSLTAVIIVIVAWAALVSYFQVPRYVMPTPMDVVRHIAEDWRALLKGFWVTFLEFLLGFILGAGAGFIFAVIMDLSRSVRGILYPILILSQAIPIVAISAALTIWLGFGLAPKLVIVALVVFFPVVVNVLDGLGSVDRDVLNLVRAMGASKLTTFRHVKLPATYSPLFSALKLSATFSVTGAVIAEWTASTSGGIGAYLLQANSRLNTAGTFAAIAFLGVLGIISFLLVVATEYLLTPWKTSSKARHWSSSYWKG